MTAAFQMMYNHYLHQGPTFRQLKKIDAIYRKSLTDYPTPQEFYRSVGLDEYKNACAARLSYALNESGVAKVPRIAHVTEQGKDGKNYFMFAKDMRDWFLEKWNNPREYKFRSSLRMMNGLVYQSGLDPRYSGHVEYFYRGFDGHGYNHSVHNGDPLPSSAQGYYGNSNVTTYIWKCGL